MTLKNISPMTIIVMATKYQYENKQATKQAKKKKTKKKQKTNNNNKSLIFYQHFQIFLGKSTTEHTLTSRRCCTC